MTALKIMECPSPNHGARPADVSVDMLIMHYTGMKSASAALERLCDPVAQVSAHYLIDEDGAVWQLVEETRRAWHAGVSSWGGATNINERSIGIELVNPGHENGYRPFPETQMTPLESLAKAIIERHAIPPHRVLGHSDVAPQRKQDPGELFDWARFARLGIGLWPRPGAEAAPVDLNDGDPVATAQDLLARVGYSAGNGGDMDDDTRHALIAFQRHYRPGRIDGQPDTECLALLSDLCAQLP